MLQQNVGVLPQTGFIPMIAPVEEWKQQTEEPLLWHQRFYAFLLLPPRSRSMLGAYKAYVKRTDPERAKQIGFSKCPETWNDAADRYNWQGRAIAYDIAQHDRYVAGIEEQRQVVEEECKTDLLVIWRKVMDTIKIKDASTMSLQGAIYAAPRILGIIREFYKMDQVDSLSLDMIMGALPAPLRSQVLANIRIGQVNITVNQASDSSALPQGDVVESKVIPVDNG